MEKTKGLYCTNWAYLRKEIKGDAEENFCDRRFIFETIEDYMLLRLTKMFEWKGLPETIPNYDLELLIMTGGISVIAQSEGNGRWKGGLYAFRNSAGDNLSPYYRATMATIANPALNMNKTVYNNVDSVFVYNDNFGKGILPLLDFYVKLMTDAFITFSYSSVNARIPSVGIAKTDNDKQALEEMFNGIYEGKKWAVCVSKSTTLDLKGTETFPFASQSSDGMKASIEAIQYFKASLFNEIGLNSNFNMKREAINSSESGMNEDSLKPLCDEMLEMRQDGARRINALFGTNISVDFSSSWKEQKGEMQKGGNEYDRDKPGDNKDTTQGDDR